MKYVNKEVDRNFQSEIMIIIMIYPIGWTQITILTNLIVVIAKEYVLSLI